MKIVTLYNHKGGVSKTTSTYHLAHALATHGRRRVLVVDADPQCNLTELLMFKLIDSLDEEERHGAKTELPGTTVRDALWPRLEGERPSVDVDAISLVQPDPKRSLFLFRGDIDLSEAEDRLSYAHSQRNTTDLHQKRNYVAVFDMLSRLGQQKAFDVVLVDVGPSAGALTRSFFLAADTFLVPVAPDRFNFQAISSLTKILSKWIAEHRQVVADFKRLGLNVPEGTPQFHGLVIQRFQRYRGAPKPSYQLWMDKITERAGTELVPALKSAGGSTSVRHACIANPVAAEIPDFASLGPKMLSAGKPVWELTQNDTGWQGKVWDERKKPMNDVKRLFFSLADTIMS
ncbi:MAG: ParA family protein [Polyangiaceae bacterium]